jgi:hypothetical protein
LIVDNQFTRQYNPEDSSEHQVDNQFTWQYNPEDSSEHQVDNQFTRQYNPEDSSEHHTRRRENLKSHIQKVLENVFPKMCICLRLLTVLPVSVASGEGSLNKLTFIKNRLRSTILEDRLYHLLTLSLEYEMAKDRVLLMSVMNSPKRRRGKNFNTIIRVKSNEKYKTSFKQFKRIFDFTLVSKKKKDFFL